MKKKLLLLLVLLGLVIPSVSFAGGGDGWDSVTVTADVSTATALSVPVRRYLYTYEIVCTADDAVDLTIVSGLGTTLETITTTGATSGEAGTFDTFWLTTSIPKYKIENISSGSCTFHVSYTE